VYSITYRQNSFSVKNKCAPKSCSICFSGVHKIGWGNGHPVQNFQGSKLLSFPGKCYVSIISNVKQCTTTGKYRFDEERKWCLTVESPTSFPPRFANGHFGSFSYPWNTNDRHLRIGFLKSFYASGFAIVIQDFKRGGG